MANQWTTPGGMQRARETASDHLRPEQFFHGSDRRIRTTVGDKTRADTPNHSYFTNDPEHARDFGRHVYHVKPTGPYQEDYYEGGRPEGKSYITAHELEIVHGDDFEAGG